MLILDASVAGVPRRTGRWTEDQAAFRAVGGAQGRSCSSPSAVQMEKLRPRDERTFLERFQHVCLSPPTHTHPSENLNSNDPPQALENCTLLRDRWHRSSRVGRHANKPNWLRM